MTNKEHITNNNVLLNNNNTQLLNAINLAKNLPSGGTTEGNIKVFNTVEEMNTSTGNNDGDIGIIYGINPVEPNTTEFNANTLLIADELPSDISISSNGLSVVNGEGLNLSLYNSGNGIILSFDTGSGGLGYYLYSRSSSSSTWKRSYEYTNNYGHIFYLNDLPEVKRSVTPNYKINSLKVTNPEDDIWNYIQFANISTIELYCYDSISNQWIACRSGLSSSANTLISGNVMLGGDGLVTGELDLSETKKLMTIPAYSRACFSDTLSDMSITEPDTYMMIDTTYFPEGLGDKRWVMLYGYSDPMGMGVRYSNIIYVLPDENNVLYHVPYETSDRFLGNFPDVNMSYNTYLKGYKINSMNAITTPSLEEISNLTVGTSIGTLLYTADSYVCTYSEDEHNYVMLYLATNAEIRDINENVLRPAGPSAATTLAGRYYTNIFGEKIEGTYTPSYEGTISPTEYNTAIDTVNDILGEEETVNE